MTCTTDSLSESLVLLALRVLVGSEWSVIPASWVASTWSWTRAGCCFGLRPDGALPLPWCLLTLLLIAVGWTWIPPDLFTFLPDFFFPDNVWPTRYMAETKFWIVPLNVCFIFFTKYFALFLTSSLLMLSLTTCFIWSVTWIISLRTSVFSLSSLSSSLKSCQEFSEISLSGWSVEVDGIFWSKIFSCCCCWCCCDVLV